MNKEDIAEIVRLSRKYSDTAPERILLGSYKDIPEPLRQSVAVQLRLGRTLGRKLPSWSDAGAFVPSAVNLEQCSSEATALLKQRWLRGEDVVLDLTGGMGVDLWAMARTAREVHYIEQSPDLALATSYNYASLSLSPECYTITSGDSITLLPELLARYRPTVLYLDPARREVGDLSRRVYAIEDCQPSLREVIDLVEQSGGAPCPRMLVKLSPMLDIKHSLRDYPEVGRVSIVSVRGEVKELLLHVVPASRRELEEVPIEAYDLTTSGEVRYFAGSWHEEAQAMLVYDHPRQYIYEPNGATMKSGLFATLGTQMGMPALHPNTHLYTSDDYREDFPGAIYRCLEIIPYSSSEVKRLHKRIARADVSCRNFPLRPEELQRKLKIQTGGNLRLMATTLRADELVLLALERVRRSS